MKVVKLEASNIKRLTAVEVTVADDQTTVIVGGPNAAGKSSVLDSIVMAMGGQALIPEEPLRLGETEGQVDLDLGELVVTRKFKREKLLCDCAAGKQAVHDTEIGKEVPVNVIHDPVHDPGCASEKFGPTKSSLLVRNKEGHAFSSPQGLLDKLLGKLTFDPLAFSRLPSDQQEATLRQVVGLNTTDLDNEYRLDYSSRATLNKQLADAQAKLKLMPRHEGVPVTEVNVSGLIEEIKKADELRTIATEAASYAERAGSDIALRENGVDAIRRNIAKLRQDLELEEQALKEAHKLLGEARERHEAATKRLSDAQAAVPDTIALNDKLRESTEVNKKVRDNQGYGIQERHVANIKGEVQSTEARMAKNLVDKKARLAALKFPVDGLAFGDHGVTFGGVPLKQASTAEQIRISVALGLALNPKFKVLLVRDGSLLDTGSIRAIGEQAAAAGAQLWLEYMTESKDGVTVMIEDGAVV